MQFLKRDPSDVPAGTAQAQGVFVVPVPVPVPELVPGQQRHGRNSENFAALLPKHRLRQSLCHRRHDAVETRSCPRPRPCPCRPPSCPISARQQDRGHAQVLAFVHGLPGFGVFLLVVIAAGQLLPGHGVGGLQGGGFLQQLHAGGEVFFLFSEAVAHEVAGPQVAHEQSAAGRNG